MTSRPRVLTGLLLVLPAFVVLVLAYVWPTIWTVWASFHSIDPIRRSGDNVGTRNYTAVVDGGFGRTLGFALLLGLLPLVMAAVVAPLLAWAAHRAGTAARWVTRGVLAVPLVCFTPAALAVAWGVERRSNFANPATAGGVLAVAVWLSTAGFVTAVGVTLFLAALRRRDPARSPAPGVAVAAVVAVLAVLAVSLQQFTFPYVLTRGGPRNATQTPALLMFNYGFLRFQFGAAAAVVTLLFVILAVLGLAATLALVLTGARLEFDPAYRSAEERTAWAPGRVVAAVATVVGLLVVFGLAVYGLYPWVHAVATARTQLPEGVSTGRVLVNTWLPPLLSAFVGVVAALLAGFGIGWLRPFGRRSPLLLLVFGPWLFVGTGVLVLRSYLTSTSLHIYNTFLGLIPPTSLVPAVFVFTLLFYGLRERPGRFGALATATVPMVVLVFGVTWLVQTQDVLWQLMAAGDPKTETAAVALLQQEGQFALGPDRLPIGLVLHPVLVVVLLLCALGLQLGYLDRLALRVGRVDAPE